MDSCNLKYSTCVKCNKVSYTKYQDSRNYCRICSKFTDFIEKYSLTSELIQEEYFSLGSILEFMNKYPFWKHAKTYYDLFKYLGLEVSLKLSAGHSKVIEKREKTSIANFGHRHNFCKNSTSRKKWEDKLFKEEGITNVFQRTEVKEKILTTLILKYSFEEISQKRTRGKKVISSLNKLLFDILSENNIEFNIEFKLKVNSVNYYSYDVLIKESKKLIEINGDYWHGNPLIYKESDIILKNTSNEMIVSDKWKKDKKKENFAINSGYDLLTIWEYDIKNQYEKTKNKILDYARS